MEVLMYVKGREKRGEDGIRLQALNGSYSFICTLCALDVQEIKTKNLGHRDNTDR